MANNKIQIKRSSVAGRVPTALQLDVGEFAVNLTDNRLFTKNTTNTVIEVHGQSLNTSANVTFSRANIGNVVTTHVSGADSLLLSSGTTDAVVIKPNGFETQFLPSGQIRPSGMLMGSSYDSNQVDVSQVAPLQLKGLLYGVELTTSPDNGSTSHVWTFGTDGALGTPGDVTANGTITANTFIGNLAWSYITSKPDLKIDITGDATGNNTFADLTDGSIDITLANTAVTPGTYGNSSVIPVLTIDSKGRVTAATTNAVAGITGYSYAAANNTFAITAGDGSVYKATIGTVNALSVSNTLNVAGVGTFSNDVVISGNLTVSGTTTYVNTTELDIGDNIITLNADVVGTPTESAGINVSRGTSLNVALLWDESTDKWTFTNDGTTFQQFIGNNQFDSTVGNIIFSYEEAASNAYANAVATAATDASTKAATAYSNATSYADAKAANAYSNAIAYAASNSYVNSTFAPTADPTFTGNVTLSTIVANGTVGTAGQVVTSNGSTLYWSTPAGVTGFAYTPANSTFVVTAGNGTTYPATITGANSSTKGIVTVVDQFFGEESTVVASANAVAYVFAVAGAAHVKADDAAANAISAYANAVAFANTIAATAYSNATSYADTKAAEAYSNAISYSGNAALAFANAVTTAAADASAKAIAAYSNAASYADTKAAAAYSNATVYADTVATTAYNNAVAVATDKAANAYANAIAYSGNAAAAYANAVAYTDGRAATNTYVNTQLALKANLSGPTFTGLTTIGGIASFTGNVQFGNTKITANGSVGTSGQILTSGGPSGNVYWSTVTSSNSVGTLYTISTSANLSSANVILTGADSTIGNVKFAGNGGINVSSNGTVVTIDGSSVSGGGGNAFGTIAVSGQSNLIADQANDTLTFIAGNNVTLTTSAGGDSITISAIGGAGGSTGNAAGNAFISGRDNFVGDGTETAFTLTQTGSANSILVLVEGLVQFHDEDYDVSGTTLTFTSAPAINEAIEVLHISGASTYHFMRYGAVDTFTGDDITTDYTLSVAANTSTATVYLDGLLQAPTTDFTISGTTLAFATAPLDGEVVLVYHVESSSSAVPTLAIAGTDTFVGDGTAADFILTSTADIHTSLVTVNGIVQRYGVDYSITGLTLTFADAPPADSAIQAMRFAGSVGTAYRSVAVGSATITADSADSTLTFANNAGVIVAVSNNTVTVGLTDIAKQSLTGNGSNTVFTLTYSATADDLFVYVNGIYFHPDEDYTVANTTLTFTTAPVDTSQIRIRFMRAPSGLISLLGDLGSGGGSYDMGTEDGPPIDLGA
jgi:hypothetical protein